MKITQNEKLFAAFFTGEGMLRISRDKRGVGRWKPRYLTEKYRPWYRQVVRITLRQDDEKVLDWVRSTIGGHIFRRGVRYKIWNKKSGTFSWSRPVTIWQAEDLETCEKVARLLIQCGIPSKKKEEAKYFLEYALFKKQSFSKGKCYSDEILKRFEFCHQKLKELKQFKES